MPITGGPDPFVPAPAVTPPAPPGQPNYLFNRRRYSYNLTPGPEGATPSAVAPPPAATTPPPAVTTPGPTPEATASQLRRSLSGQAIWDIMSRLPDAYRYAMFNALSGGGAGENDLQAAVQHNMFGGDQNAMNQWRNYWGHINPSSAPIFDANTGRFRWIDTGFNLDDAQYTRHLNEFATGQEGTGQWMNRGLDHWGINWNPSGMAQIGQAPWYSFVGAPPGQQEQFYATPVGTSPYTGAWGNPAAGAASFNGPVGGGYLPPYGSPLMATPAGQATIGSMAPPGTSTSSAATPPPAITTPPPVSPPPASGGGGTVGEVQTTTAPSVVTPDVRVRSKPYTYQAQR